MALKPLISIIMPVFNAQKTVIDSLQSILKQRYEYIELLLINDCSTDKTLTILTEFQSAYKSEQLIIKVISHPLNMGVASARNTGLLHAEGEYIYYVDADDRIEPDALSNLVSFAIEENADIVGCNWFLSFDTNERKMNQPAFCTPIEALHQMCQGTMRWNLWLFLVRSSLYRQHQISFLPQMNMGEDLMVMFKLFAVATKVRYLDKPLYHYGQSNAQSLTKIYSDLHITQVNANLKEVEHYFRISKPTMLAEDYIDFLKLNIKLPLLISDDFVQYQKWQNWFPESNKKIMQNTAQPLRTRLLQWLASKGQFGAIRLYYKIIIQFIYGKIYK